MRQIQFVLLIISFLPFISCNDSKIVVIEDFSKRQEFNFTASEQSPFHSGNNVEAIFIDVKGEINGKIRIGGYCGGDLATGKIDTTFRCDWYGNTGIMLVIPLEPTKGKLNIRFSFSKI